MKRFLCAVMLIMCAYSQKVSAQLPGYIVRPLGTAGPLVLDPNQNGYTSKTTAGFGTNDITNSEIGYKIVAPVISEPTGDLLRGPSGKYSDIVKTFDGSGFYLYSDSTNLLCRLRIGGIVSGSKGYSILLDTDGKFGPSGSSADPNFQAATTGVNGNPGFEYEVVLETNFRIAIYNVDGTSTPALVTSYTIATNSQISIASTTDGGDADYFYDFYVPLSAMGLTLSSPIRAVATTVMSPGPAIGGPKSDIYGLSGTDYMNDWIRIINTQPPFTPGSITSTGGGLNPACTEAPSLNSPIAPSAVSVSGSWTKSPYSSLTSAKIVLYKNGVAYDSTTINSGNTWTIAVAGFANGDVITAKAQAVGESRCLSSNEVIVNGCTTSTHANAPVITCSATRGFEGTMTAGTTVSIYRTTSSGYALFADDATTTYKVTYPTSTTWRYDDVNSQSGSACTGGAADITAGAYTVIATGTCASTPVQVCLGGLTASTTPVLTSELLTGVSIIKGTAAANAGVNLFINGYFVQSVVSTATGAFTFTLTKKLEYGQSVVINSATSTSCYSTDLTGTVTCYVAPPIITATNRYVSTGSQLIGTSTAGSGSTVTIYNATTLASLGTATVQSDGTWTLTSPTAASGTKYIARITGHTCGTSAASDTVFVAAVTSSARCGTITLPTNDAVSSVSGTVTTAVAGTTVILYIDGNAADSVQTSTTNWTIPVNSTIYNKIYPSAVLTIGVHENGKLQTMCSATQNVPCTTPATPVISPASTTIYTGNSATINLSSSENNFLYSVRNSADTDIQGDSKGGTGGSLTLTTNVFSTMGTYTVNVKATSVTGGTCSSIASFTVYVTAVLPVNLLEFNGKKSGNGNKLSWTTSMEQDIVSYELQRSIDGRNFSSIATVPSLGNTYSNMTYTFEDLNAGRKAYYRLKINDQQASSSRFSKIIMLQSDMGIAINQVGPNPFHDVLQLKIDAETASSLVIKLTDMSGRQLQTKTVAARKGTNDITLNGLSKYAGGNYVLEIWANGERVVSQMVKKD